MKVGAVYPQIELEGSPAALREIGLGVEAMGLDHLTMYDHVVGAVHAGRTPPLSGPYTDTDPFHDPFVAFGYLAAITEKIGFVTGVLILPQRQTVLVAKQATDLDLLSGGRLCLGVGVGWNYVEYDALGQDFSTRGQRLTEQAQFLRRLWSEARIDWKGKFDRIERANIVPRPKRQIPIYFGGFTEPALKRAARLGDGFIFGGALDGILPNWRRLRDLLQEEGRSVEDFGAHAVILDEGLRGLNPDEAAAAIRKWEDAGGTHASIVSMGRKFRSATEHVDYFSEVTRRL